jgi:hypothetical protein
MQDFSGRKTTINHLKSLFFTLTPLPFVVARRLFPFCTIFSHKNLLSEPFFSHNILMTSIWLIVVFG